MCGYNAKLLAKDHAYVSDQCLCQDCADAGMQTFLCVGDQLPEHIIEDDEMPTWPKYD